MFSNARYSPRVGGREELVLPSPAECEDSPETVLPYLGRINPARVGKTADWGGRRGQSGEVAGTSKQSYGLGLGPVGQLDTVVKSSQTPAKAFSHPGQLVSQREGNGYGIFRDESGSHRKRSRADDGVDRPAGEPARRNVAPPPRLI